MLRSTRVQLRTIVRTCLAFYSRLMRKVNRLLVRSLHSDFGSKVLLRPPPAGPSTNE